jgi:hypothetical protein
MLVQQKQSYVDADGDTHVATQPQPPRGTMGSTDHLKDDQFFLNIPFSEVEFNTVVNVTWVRPAAQMSKLDYVGLYAVGDADDAIPCNWEFASGEEGAGQVELQMTNHGDMEIRYFDVAADRPRVSVPILVHEPCPNNCTNHGICQKGQCVCFSPYKGEECCEVGGKIAVDLNVTTTTIGKGVQVTLTPPAGELDKRNWIGLFKVSAGDDAQALLSLSQEQAPSTTSDQESPSATEEEVEMLNTTATPPLIWRYVNGTVDMPMPYVPGQYVLKVIKNVGGNPVIGSSAIIWIHGECPNNCSGHGTCQNGTCVCDEGFNHTMDCSIGDGLVRLAVSPTECLAGSIVTVTWERNTNAGFSNLDYVALFDESDTTFDAPFAYQFAQPEEMNVSPQLEPPPSPPPPQSSLLQTTQEPLIVDRGVVEFNAPASKAKFVVRYFRKDHALFSVSSPIEVYFDCPVTDCSGHGKCVKGDCQCDEGWKGIDCSIGDGPITISAVTEPRVINSVFDVSWTRPEKIGSVYDFIALYSHEAPNDQPFMYRYASNPEGDGQTSGQVKLQLPSRPGLYEARYIDAFNRSTIALTETILAHLPCPHDCSGHGTCDKDTCLCDAEWTVRDDCSAKVGVVQITATPLTLETPSENAKITVTYKRPEGSGSPQDYIGLFPKSQGSAKHPVDFAMPSGDYGTIQFSVPHYEGLYQVKYIGGPNNEVRAHTVDIDVTKACRNHCSDHGVCNRGLCECISGWGSDDCSVGQGPTTVTVGPHFGHPGDKLLITYTRPVNNGGPNDLLAIYYKGATDMTTPLGFVMATDNDHDTLETKMPTVESDLEVHYVRASDQKSLGVSQPLRVVFACKDECNDHGDCKLGFCTCHDGYDGFSCEKSVPTAFRLSVVGATSVAPMGSISVAWEAVPKKSSVSDLIGLFLVGDPSANPVVYDYTSMKPAGTVDLVAPFQPGQYVARYMGAHQGFAEVLAESETISVVQPPKKCPDDCSNHGVCDTTTGACDCTAGWSGNNCATAVPTEWAVSTDALEYEPSYWIDVQWTRPPDNNGNNEDHVALYEAGSTSLIDKQWVGYGNEGKRTFTAPTPSGNQQTYRFQFMNGATGQPMATSSPFVVKKPAAVSHAAKKAKRVHH